MTEFKDRFHIAMKTSFREPTMDMMRECGHLSLPRARRVVWQVMDSDKMKEENGNVLRGVRKWDVQAGQYVEDTRGQVAGGAKGVLYRAVGTS